jgi:hypothetical protein
MEQSPFWEARCLAAHLVNIFASCYGTPGPPTWGLDARQSTLLCKQIIVAKSKEVKTGCSLAEPSKEGYG